MAWPGGVLCPSFRVGCGCRPWPAIGHGHWLGSLCGKGHILQWGRVQCRAPLQGAVVGWAPLLLRVPGYVALEAMFNSWSWLLTWLPARTVECGPQQRAARAQTSEGMDWRLC